MYLWLISMFYIYYKKVPLTIDLVNNKKTVPSDVGNGFCSVFSGTSDRLAASLTYCPQPQ